MVPFTILSDAHESWLAISISELHSIIESFIESFEFQHFRTIGFEM